jgi:hypothetical protein
LYIVMFLISIWIFSELSTSMIIFSITESDCDFQSDWIEGMILHEIKTTVKGNNSTDHKILGTWN